MTIPTVKVKFQADGDESEVVDLTGADLLVMVQKAYDLSVPQGMGFLHYLDGHTINDEQADMLLEAQRGSMDAFRLDYVHGRSVKLTVYRAEILAEAPEGITMFMHPDWYDHSEAQLEALLEACMPKKED